MAGQIAVYKAFFAVLAVRHIKGVFDSRQKKRYYENNENPAFWQVRHFGLAISNERRIAVYERGQRFTCLTLALRSLVIYGFSSCFWSS